MLQTKSLMDYRVFLDLMCHYVSAPANRCIGLFDMFTWELTKSHVTADYLLFIYCRNVRLENDNSTPCAFVQVTSENCVASDNFMMADQIVQGILINWNFPCLIPVFQIIVHYLIVTYLRVEFKKARIKNSKVPLWQKFLYKRQKIVW